MISVVRNILLPFSIPYGGAVRVRNFGYDSGLLKVKRLPVPVFSVGNISVGGSGKTPFVMYLIGILLRMGKKPAVLSRGYKRLTNDLVIACPDKGFDADVQSMGDEPALISLKFPQIPVGVHPDRYRAGMAVLKEFGADVFVLDDGFQHRELHRDLDFVLMRNSLPDFNDRYLPAGNLRDSRRRLKDADVIVLTAHRNVTGGPDHNALLKNFTDAPIAVVSFLASDLVDHAGSTLSTDFIHEKDVAAFCGIASPEQFFETVEMAVGNNVMKKSFGDHHWYDEYDIDEIFGGNEDRLAVTTMKDAVRIFADEELSKLDEVRRIYAITERPVFIAGEAYVTGAISKSLESVYA